MSVAEVRIGLIGDLHGAFDPVDGSLERLPLGGIRLNHIERVAIEQTLEQVGGNESAAARALGIAVSTLYEKLKRHGL
jgi:DNA-binding NtrC family response regulator